MPVERFCVGRIGCCAENPDGPFLGSPYDDDSNDGLCPCAAEVSWDGKTVWVCDQEGATIGRYSSARGIDIHGTLSEQIDGRLCVDCRPDVTGDDGWKAFTDGMAAHHRVRIPDEAKPLTSSRLQPTKPSSDSAS